MMIQRLLPEKIKDRLRPAYRSFKRLPPVRLVRKIVIRSYVKTAYRYILLRDADQQGLEHYVQEIMSGIITKDRFLEIIRGSEEFYFRVPFRDLPNSLHLSRCDFVRSFPQAARILDLGGSHQSNPEGAFVHLGYPYPFEKLVIVELPLERRHELYQHSQEIDRIDTRLGPVFYRYSSMTDLSGIEDREFDLAYSGQSIEHVSPEDADVCFQEVMRVLQPGGYFCLDTPNARICRLEREDFINPDHKVEYTHEQISSKLEAVGFEILEAIGLNYCGGSAAEGKFSLEEAAANRGLFWEITDCYLLAYICRKPH